MKKLIIGIIAGIGLLVVIAALQTARGKNASFGNQAAFDKNFTFGTACVKIHGKWTDVNVEKWHYYPDNGLVTIWTDTQILMTHSSNVVFSRRKSNVVYSRNEH